MSAESPRRGLHKNAQVISPQPISDRSIIDSVAGIINDIVPQAYAGTPNPDNKESITWARFEHADVNDPLFYPDYTDGSSTPPLLLVLGYTSGVQVWLVAASGEATQVLSWRQSVVRILRFLPDPKKDEDNPDLYEQKRPIIAICDSSGTGPQFCSLNFISLRTGEQFKSIKFKNPVCDVLANKNSIVVTFAEKIAVFDAKTFEDIMTVTSCYPCPGPTPNPVALGTRWLAYSEKKLLPARRSSGGSEGEGVQTYTAAVLYAAKSLGKGLRGLGETVASSLTGNSVPPLTINNTGGDFSQPGVITILDLQAAKHEKELDDASIEPIVAHFTAHSDAIVAMTFDQTGAVLMTADRRGHDFHVFRIQPHPGGPTLAAVHHLYVLHRGDTTAKVQDMVFSSDTRWAAVSTVRGTTHVFPVAPYGGPVGMRTHSTPHVVNRLSRFHRSAGLTDDSTRSHSPVSHIEMPISVYPYSNPRLPPYPHPTVLHPLAQIRQPSVLNHINNQSQSRPQQRQRLSSDDNGTLPIKICASFAPSRAWIFSQRDSTNKINKRPVESLFIMACHGNMIQYDLEPKPASGIPKEKVCDDTMIELEVGAKGQWPLQRTPTTLEILPPLPPLSPLLCYSNALKTPQHLDSIEDRWLSQVEIVTHAGPHRRLWMGPQFVFKTYNAPSGGNLMESEAVEIGVSAGSRPARSNPVNMPHTSRPLMPVVIDGSGSSYEQSPRFMEAYGDSLESENVGIGNGENQLREDLAEAMLETSPASHRVTGRRLVVERVGQPVTKVVNPLGTVITVMADEEDASASQEFDVSEDCSIIENHKSVCAEEGPASLGDFNSEGNLLRNLTEICAEMRTASEPAFDNVSDEDIREVREQKSLCVQATTMNSSVIDYEREGAFRDIPTSLSLCVEPGEIPNSPMTQARENLWNKRAECKEIERQKKNFASAKYVVSYDDDRVTLQENQIVNLVVSDVKNHHNVKELLKITGKQLKSSKPTVNDHQPNFILHENADSIVIEDSRLQITEKVLKSTIKKSQISEKIEKKSGKLSSSVKKPINQQQEAMIVEAQLNPHDSFVELQVADVAIDKELIFSESEPMEAAVATICGVASLPSDLPALDEDYHIVEPNLKTAGYSQQSDEEIEYIQGSDVTVIHVEKTDDIEVSPIRQRKGSKSTFSDDDLEHINTAELSELFERAKSLIPEKNDTVESPDRLGIPNKPGLSSDDDLEHVSHPEIVEAAQSLSKETSLSISSVKLTSNKALKSNEGEKPSAVRQRTSRKRKDIVVIENDTPQAEVTVVVKSLTSPDTWNKSKCPENDLTEEIDCCSEPKERLTTADHVAVQRIPKKTRVRGLSKAVNQSAIQNTSNTIEIIDIDAMQKAEMEITNVESVPECQILESCQVPIAKMKKSRRIKELETTNISPSHENVDKADSKSIERLNWSPTVNKSEVSDSDAVQRVGGMYFIEKEENSSVQGSLQNQNSLLDSKKSKKRGKKGIPVDTNCPAKNLVEPESKELSEIAVLPTEKPNLTSKEVVNVTDNSKEDVAEEIVEVSGEMAVENVKKEGKFNVSEEDVAAEGSSSSDDLNANVVPMDTEEDGSIREGLDKNASITASPSWSTAGKKNNRSKKKKRR